MNLIKSLNIHNKDVITITGGGGKTSLMFAIGRELSQVGIKHVLTTTAKICVSDVPANQCIINEDITAVFHQIQQEPNKEWIIGKELLAGKKISGFSNDELLFLQESLSPVVILNEGDGSKRKPYKFYNEYEPIIPDLTTKIIHVIGAEVLFQKIDDEYFHRSELFEDKDEEEVVFDEHVLKKVLEAFIKNKLEPEYGKLPKILFINKADQDNLEKARIMGKIGKLLFDQCFIGSLREGWIEAC